MDAQHLALGAEGEARAAAHLRRRGYRIVARNVHAGGVEIDLIARRGSLYVFVHQSRPWMRASGRASCAAPPPGSTPTRARPAARVST